MFNDEETFAFKKMHDFSTADGFVEITEDLSDMINFLAKEPSVGLFYIQQHTHNSTANLLSLEANVLRKSHETSLHTEDLEDSITMLGSMKECGFPIVDEMIKEIKRSLSIISTKKPKRGLITHSKEIKRSLSIISTKKPKRGLITHRPNVGFLGQVGSWSPATWGQISLNMRLDGEGRNGYLSDTFRSAISFKGVQVEEVNEASGSEGEGISTHLDPMVATAPESCFSLVRHGSINVHLEE